MDDKPVEKMREQAAEALKQADEVKAKVEAAAKDAKETAPAEEIKDAVKEATADVKDAAKETADDVKDAAEKAVAEVKDVVSEDGEEAPADVEVNVIDDRDDEAESLINWAAARAGVIVVTPGLGTLALMANEVYMITKLGAVYGVELPHKAILSFIGSLGATVIGSTLATIIPIPVMQIPIGVSVTYGVGKAAMRWIKDGMPDDTKPYQEVFEEERKEGSEKADQLEENPDKDKPLGDEKRNFMKELKDNIDDAYPEKAHAVVDDMAGNLVETFNTLGEKIVAALKKAGMTDEQIDKAKYTAIGATEVAQETAEKTAKDLKAVARIKSREFRKDAADKAEEIKARAKDSMEDMQKKHEELKRQSDLKGQQAKLRSEKLKAQARVQIQEAKIQANKLKDQAKEQMEAARAKAQEISNLAKEKSKDYKEASVAAANTAKENFRAAADEFRAKTEERAAQRRKEDLEAGNHHVEPAEKADQPDTEPKE